MEQKRQKLLEQLKRMKEQAKHNVEDRNPFYVMHAECALEFAELGIEVLTAAQFAQAKEEASDKPIKFVLEAFGNREEVNTNAVIIAYDDDGVPGVVQSWGKADRFNLFNCYVSMRCTVTEMEKKHPVFKEAFEKAEGEGMKALKVIKKGCEEAYS